MNFLPGFLRRQLAPKELSKAYNAHAQSPDRNRKAAEALLELIKIAPIEQQEKKARHSIGFFDAPGEHEFKISFLPFLPEKERLREMSAIIDTAKEILSQQCHDAYATPSRRLERKHARDFNRVVTAALEAGIPDLKQRKLPMSLHEIYMDHNLRKPGFITPHEMNYLSLGGRPPETVKWDYAGRPDHRSALGLTAFRRRNIMLLPVSLNHLHQIWPLNIPACNSIIKTIAAACAEIPACTALRAEFIESASCGIS